MRHSPHTPHLKLVTWNVNGLRSIVSRQQGGQLRQFLEDCCCAADIICLQETKLRRSELTRELCLAEGWESFWSCCQPKIGPSSGYAGVATFCKAGTVPIACEAGLTGSSPTTADAVGEPQQKRGPANSAGASNSTPASPLTLQLSEELGLSLDVLAGLDSEGRALVTDHGTFVLVNLYGPALTIEERLEERLAFKLNFYRVLEWRVRRWVSEGRAVVVVGDLNISPQPMDSCKPGPVADFVRRPDRQWLNQLLADTQLGLADCFRHFHPDREGAYTCWNTASGARQNNWGSRIDHILVCGPAPQQLAAHLQAPSAQAVAQQGPPTITTGAAPSCAGSAAVGPQAAAGPADTAAPPAAATAPPLLQLITECDINAEQLGSDHAPVWASLAISHELLPSGHAPPAGAASRMFPGKQTSVKAWLQQQQQLPQLLGQQGGTQQEPEPTLPALGQSMDAAGSEGCSQGRAPSQSVSGAQAVSSGGASTLSAAGKRPVAAATNPAAGSKRARTAAQGTAAGGKGALAAGQRSLKSFFGAPAASQATVPQAVQQLDETRQQQQQQQEQGGMPAAPAAAAASDGAPGGAQQGGLQSGSEGVQVDAGVHQQQQQQPQPAPVDEEVQRALQAHEQETRAAWQRIANRMEAPKCRGHGEACVLRTVKKSGHRNQGGQFWACARAAGPPPVGQCRTWIPVSKPPKFKSGGS